MPGIDGTGTPNIPAIQMKQQAADPSAPPASTYKFYFKSGGAYYENSSGTVTQLMNNPMTTQGDLIYGGASGVPTRLAGGTSGYILTSNGPTSAPSWQANAGGSPNRAFFTYLAAGLEPDAIEPMDTTHYNTFTYPVNSATTKLLVSAWQCQIGSASGRLDLRHPFMRLPLRNTTLYGSAGGSMAVIINPSLPSYSNAESTYYSRLNTLFTSSLQSLPITAASTRFTLLPGPYGSIIMHQTSFNFTWLAGLFDASSNGWAFQNEIGDTGSSDYFRTGDNLYLPVHKGSLCAILSGASGGTGTALGNVSYVVLPSTWSAVTDSLAPYTFREDFMGSSLDTASTWTRSATPSSDVEIYTPFQWLKMIGNAGDQGLYTQTSFTRANGLHFLCDVYMDTNSSVGHNLIVGWLDGAGVGQANCINGIYFSSSAGVKNLYLVEAGAVIGPVGSAWLEGNIYRCRITLGGTGGNTATYEIQSSGTDYSTTLGGSTWTNISSGSETNPTTTPLHAGAIAHNTPSAVVNYVSDVRVY